MPRFALLALVPPLLFVALGCETRIADPAPTLSIESPALDDTFTADDTIRLRIRAEDDVDPPDRLVVRWSVAGGPGGEETPGSDGVVEETFGPLDAGDHVIEVAVEDTDGNVTSGTRALSVEAVNTPPTCSLTSPEDGALVAQGGANVFEGRAEDVEDPAEDLRVELEVQGVVRATAEIAPDGAWSALVDGLDLGSVRVTAVVYDTGGATCEAPVQVSVSSAPEVEITFPTAGASVNAGGDLVLRGTATDYQDPEFSLNAVWSSDVDGALGTSIPNSIGDVTLEAVELSSGPQTLTLAVTDLDGLTGRASVQVTVNAAPSPPEARILPPAPEADDILSVYIDVESVDPEGGPVTYTWRWSRDGTAEPFFDDRSIPATQTARGEVWTAEVRGVDEQGARSEPTTASATVANGVPVTTAPSIYPQTAQSDTVLYCSAGTTTDPEGDPTTVSFTWEADGIYLGSGGALSAGAAIVGETVVCLATPHDGISSGVPVPSSGVTIENAPPSAPVPQILPASPSAADALSCFVAVPSTDLDGDPVGYSYDWLVDGLPTVHTGTTLAASLTTDGDGWTCAVTPDDGSVSGPPGFVTVTVGTGPIQQLDVSSQASVYTGPSTRGFWFQAPTSMTLHGVRVPDTLAGDQSVEVLRLDAAPPEFPGSTTAFTSLFGATAVAGTGFVSMNVGVAAGDWIGVLGGRGAADLSASYASPGAYSSGIDGASVALTRLVYQGNLALTGGATAVSSEPAGAIGRVEVEYSVP